MKMLSMQRPLPSIEIRTPAACKRPVKAKPVNWAALIGIENLRLAMASQRLIECLDAKARVQGVRQPPSQHMPTRPIHDRHQLDHSGAAKSGGWEH